MSEVEGQLFMCIQCLSGCCGTDKWRAYTLVACRKACCYATSAAYAVQHLGIVMCNIKNMATADTNAGSRCTCSCAIR